MALGWGTETLFLDKVSFKYLMRWKWALNTSATLAVLLAVAKSLVNLRSRKQHHRCSADSDGCPRMVLRERVQKTHGFHLQPILHTIGPDYSPLFWTWVMGFRTRLNIVLCGTRREHNSKKLGQFVACPYVITVNSWDRFLLPKDLWEATCIHKPRQCLEMTWRSKVRQEQAASSRAGW